MADFEPTPELMADLAFALEAIARRDELATPGDAWYHVSPHKLIVGDVLLPGGATPASADFYAEGWGEDTGTLVDMGRPRTGFVWMARDRKDAMFWRAVLHARYLYTVQPFTDPQPWNGSASDGWVTTAARILTVEDLGE